MPKDQNSAEEKERAEALFKDILDGISQLEIPAEALSLKTEQEDSKGETKDETKDPEEMTKTEKQVKFVELRAQQVPYSEITKALKISKTTCVAWNKELQENIEELKDSIFQGAYAGYAVTAKYRMEVLQTGLSEINEEIARRDLSDITTDRLFYYRLQFVKALQGEAGDLRQEEDSAEAIQVIFEGEDDILE